MLEHVSQPGNAGIFAIAANVHVVRPGIGGLSVRMDGNQLGMFAGGIVILIGALASSGVLRERRSLRKTARKRGSKANV